MKKTGAALLLILLGIAAVSCGKKDHAIQYDLGNAAGHFTAMPEKAKAGETVELRTEILYDAGIHVYVDGQEIPMTHYDSDYWGYSFTMPKKDVLVTARFHTKEEVWGSGTATNRHSLAELKEAYPDCFGLSTFKGLEVYIWQMAPNSYSFSVLAGTNREKTLQELLNMKGMSAEDMRTVLQSYDVDESEIIVIPWQNPISSYISEYWVKEKDESAESVAARRRAYIEEIRKMLFE